MILIHADEFSGAPAPGTTAHLELEADWSAFEGRLVDGGHWIAGANLQPTETATTVRRTWNGTPVLTNGPCAETAEQLVGFYLVSAADLEEALGLATALPVHAGSIEVRPVAHRAVPAGREDADIVAGPA